MASNPEFLKKHRLSVDDYHRMSEAGILPHDARVELINGEIIDMSPIGSRHAGTVTQLAHILGQQTDSQAVISVQNPLALGQHSEPEPDICLLKPRQDFYKSRHPEPQDVLLIIEVADVSLRYDTEIKVPLYAKHAIPEVWLVNLVAKRVTAYSSPEADNYRKIIDVKAQDTLSPHFLPRLNLRLSELFS